MNQRKAIDLSTRLTAVCALALAAIWLLFFKLGAMSFIDPDEGRYTLAAREMWQHGNWFLATLNLAPYPDKPAPFFWLLGALLHFSGSAEWAARLSSALPALATLALVFYWSRQRLGFLTAVFSTAVLMTAGEFFALSRIVRMDALLSFTISLSLFSAYELLAGTKRWSWWVVYLSAALGLLVKGPIAVLLASLIIVAYALLSGPAGALRKLRPAPGFALLIVVAGCWFIPAALSNPSQLRIFIVDHNLARFLTAKVGHPQPWYFFLWALPACFMPWSIFLPATIATTARQAIRRSKPHLFLATWCIVTFCLFSFSRAKLAPYVLPLFPALAILTGDALARLWRRAGEPSALRAWRLSAQLWSGLCVVAALAALGTAAFGPVITRGLCLLLSTICIASGLASLVLITKRREQLISAAMFVTSILVFTLWSVDGATVTSQLASLEQAAPVASALPPGTRLYAYKTHGYSLSFYSGKRLSQLNTAAKAAALLEHEAPRAVLIKRKHLPRLQRYLESPATVWWQGYSQRVLLANRPLPSGYQRYGLLFPSDYGSTVAVKHEPDKHYRKNIGGAGAVKIEAPVSPHILKQLVRSLVRLGQRLAGISGTLW